MPELEKKYNLKWLNDPGHGWLEVPRWLVNELGISQEITGYSYMQFDMVYLEEDLDASTFLRACKERGIEIETEETHHDDDRVRNLTSYKPLPSLHPGDEMECSMNLEGIATIRKGNKAIYLGNSQIRMLDGPSKDWIFTLTITAPFVQKPTVGSKK